MRKNFLRFFTIRIIALAIFAGVAIPLLAQQTAGDPAADPSREAAPTPDELTPNIRIRSNLVETPVTVTNSKDEFVYDLTEKDFRILDNGVQQHIVNFLQESRPLAVVILIQTNEEVKPLLHQLEPLSPLFTDLLLGKEGTAAVVTFNKRITVAQNFSNSGDTLTATLKGLKTQWDDKRLNDALVQAIGLLADRPNTERRIIVAFSDGFDSGSETAEKDVVQRATAAEVTIYGIGFSRTHALMKSKPHEYGPSPLDQQVTRPNPPNTPPTPTIADNTYGNHGSALDILGAAAAVLHSAVGQPPMDFYAKYTGGEFYSHWSEKALQEQFGRMASDIHSQYELAYVPQSTDEPGFHTIKVEVRRPGVKVRTRAGYIYTASKH